MATQTITETTFIEPTSTEQQHSNNTNNNNDSKSNGLSETKEDPDRYSQTSKKEYYAKKLGKENGGYIDDGGDADSIGTSNSLDSDGSDVDEDNCVHKLQVNTSSFFRTYAAYISKLVLVACLIAYTIYFGFAVNYNVEAAKALIVITGIVLFCLVYRFIRDHYGDTIYNKFLGPYIVKPMEKHWPSLQWIVYPALLIGLVLYLTLSVVKDIQQLQSISGMVCFISLTYLTSVHPDKVTWRPVIWGYGLQFLLAIVVLRWETGYRIVDFFGAEITKFINYAYDGAAVVYGDPWMIFHPFAFIGLSMIIYMGAVMSILYYYGITQAVAAKTAWLMQRTMGTTAIETLGVASNIFLNGMDTMLMLRHYLDKLTPSEFHTFLVGGHSTVAGFVFGLFVLFGAPPQHLLSAAVMSAPAVIGITKLNYPETRKSITKRVEDVDLQKGGETNVFEACANGAAVAGKTVAAVLTNYIAFMALLAWVNATLSWMGGRVGYPQLSFELICSYLFWPISLLIGVEISQCREVAKLIGIKLFTTEILAYQELGKSARAGLINDRSRTLATYALCGFSSLSTLAIAVGVWQVICPQKVSDMASQMARALINANTACFMTACVSGIMYREDLVVDSADMPSVISWFFGIIPGYKDLISLVPGYG